MVAGNAVHRWLTFTLLVIAALFLSASPSHAAPKLEAHVDRSAIEAEDTLTLTLRIDDTGSYEPDLKPLEKDFSLLAVNNSSGIEASIGHMQRWTEWQITLSPLRSGDLTIPALAIDGARSNPIAIKVRASGGRDSATGNGNGNEKAPVFIEATLDHDSVYVQQQTLLTVRVYNAIALDRMNITEPEFDNATVRKLAQHNFQTDISGETYQVHELVYAIFPQKSGDLTIPELVFSANEAQQVRSLFDFPRPGRSVRKLSRQLTLHVKPVPKQFTGKVWLPARNLTAQETWGGNPQNMSVGNSITRSIAIQADGLMAAQLPALEAPTLDNAKLYADQPALDDQADGEGMHGKRTETTALIPAREGTLQLPEVRVVWWDIDSDSEKVATIPAETLTILPGSATPAAAPSAAPLQAPANSAFAAKSAEGSADGSANSNALSKTTETALTGTAPNSTTTAWLPARVWMVISALLALAWLVTLWFLWRAKHSIRIEKPKDKFGTADQIDDEKLLRNAIDAANRNDAHATHALIGRWMRKHYPQTPTLSQWLAEAKTDVNLAEVATSLEALQRHLYSTSTNLNGAESIWNGAELARQLAQVGKRRPQKTTPTVLPPLYPVA